jgi:hypothetical protein
MICSVSGHGAQGAGLRAQGSGHGAWSMEHGAQGVGQPRNPEIL